jgi:PAS domain S-box-containing protein
VPVRDAAGAVAGVLSFHVDATERVRAGAERARLAAALGAERERLRAVLLQAPTPIALLVGPEHRLDLVNDAYRRVSGGRDVTGLTFREAYPELEGQPFSEIQDRVYATGEPWSASAVLVRYDRLGSGVEDAYFDLRYEPVRDADGRVFALLNYGVDVTEQTRARVATEAALRQAERAAAALAESEARYRALAELSPDAAWVNQDDRLVYANPAAARLLGAESPESVLGRSPFEIVEPAHHPMLRERMANVLAHPGPAGLAEMRWRRFDGSAVDVESSASAITWEGRPAVQVIFRDVTARKRDEAALAASEAKYRALFATMDQGFCLIHVLLDDAGRAADYRFLEANPAFERQTGLVDAAGRTARELVAGLEQHWIDVYGRVALTGEPTQFVQGSEAMGRWFDVHAFRVGAPAERRVAILFTDVSAARAAAAERERLLAASERARSEAEAANRAKADFLAVMSHELRTPLNAIGGYAQLMELGLQGPVTPDQVAALGRIQRGQQHLLGLINAVLNYAKLEAGQVRYEVADVSAAETLAEVAALVAPQARAKGLALDVRGADPAGADLVARADPEKVRQVLLNLLSNAVKFTRGGGAVSLACSRTPDGCVAFDVTDTGRGIAAEQLARVFEPFVQVDQRLTRTDEGTGLGLAISRDLARGMGGDLTARSTPGAGSTFTLTLPAATPAAARAAG